MFANSPSFTSNVIASQMTYYPASGNFTIDNTGPNTYSVQVVVLFNPIDNSDITTFSVWQQGVSVVTPVWSYNMRIPRLYGSTTVSPIPVPISLYITTTGADVLNFKFSNSDGQTSQIMAGSTVNITGLAIGLNSQKTFVIDHPMSLDKYLVHACLEGPEAGVYYRGTAKLDSDGFVEVSLPEYVKSLAYNFTINVTHNFDEDTDSLPKIYASTRVKNNKFRIYGPSGSVFWNVYGTRQPIEVEPLKDYVNVKGSGPYRWI